MTDTSSSSSSSARTRGPVRAIVTGHNRGVGAALAELLLARGIAVLGIARRRHDTLATRFPAVFDEAELDLADAARVAHWADGDALPAFVAGADTVVLFNNAGTVEPIGPLDAQRTDAIVRAVALNVTAPLVLASAFAKATGAVNDRRIVHVSSGAARNATAGWSVYCATKAALDHHARGIALDASRGLRVCSIAPGVVDTGMQQTIRATSVEHFPQRARFEALKNDGKLTSAEDAARKLIDYALSERFGSVPTADVRELPAD